MKASTVAALDRINRNFYARRAAEFSATRKRPWPGWRKVLAVAREHLGGDRISVLDLACGNGRFLTDLDAALGKSRGELEYCGIDASVSLLTTASRAAEDVGHATTRLVAADLVQRPLAVLGAGARFDLVVGFGLMHHVPSLAARERLLSASARSLRPGGVLAVSFWQFGAHDRFRKRCLPPAAAAARGIAADDLEPGDQLLAWGDEGDVRYCHYADRNEAAALVGTLNLEVLDTFRDDGARRELNLYYVLRKADALGPGD